MAIAFVQEANATGSTSVALTLGATPTVGNLLVVICESQTNHTNQSLTGFTKAAGLGSGTGTALWYRVVQSGDGTGHTVSITSGTSSEAHITEWSGTHSSPLDDTATGSISPSNTTGTVGPVDPTVADSVVIGGVGLSNTVSNSFAETGALTLRYNGGRLGTADLILAAATSTSSTFTWSGNRTGTMVLANFKAAAGATVFGTAVGTYTFSGTASGTPTVLGTAAGSYSFSGTASGTPTVLGTAAGSYSFSGTASGTPTVLGVAAGSYTFSGTATGTPTVLGVGVGTYSFSGVATGLRTVTSIAVGSFAFSGTATATVTVLATAVGAYTFAGDAIGSGPAVADPHPRTATFRATGHTGTYESFGHTGTYRAHGHTATYRESR